MRIGNRLPRHWTSVSAVWTDELDVGQEVVSQAHRSSLQTFVQDCTQPATKDLQSCSQSYLLMLRGTIALSFRPASCDVEGRSSSAWSGANRGSSRLDVPETADECHKLEPMRRKYGHERFEEIARFRIRLRKAIRRGQIGCAGFNRLQRLSKTHAYTAPGWTLTHYTRALGLAHILTSAPGMTV